MPRPYEIFPRESDVCLSAQGLSSGTEFTADSLLSRCADVILTHGLGTIFGRWVGRNGCPLVNEPTSNISIPPIKLFSALDSYVDEHLPHSHSPMPSAVSGSTTANPLQQQEYRDKQVDGCLRSAIYAYTARWLPLFAKTERSIESPIEQCDEISKACWRTARKDMLKVINRPCYRSVLALYLFGQTPVPVGIPQEEELDGLNGVVCSQTALLHVQQLRERLRCCQFNGSEVSAWSDAAVRTATTTIAMSDITTGTTTTASFSPDLTEEYLNLESRAYWAAVTWDTSDSMTLNFRSTLSSGLKGACSEPVWQLSRAFLVGSFHDRAEDWRRKGFRVSDDVAPQITSATSVCTIYTWRNIASLKEALREGVEEATVQAVWKAFLDAIDIFRTTIHPILANCERQLHFLGQVDRFNWYEIVLLYYLGILILVDVLEAAHRADLLHELAQTSLEADHECFNVLKFGLESSYTIGSAVRRSAIDGELSDATDESSSLAVSFVAIDPYPHHVIAAVRLMDKAFSRQYLQGSIKRETYVHLSSTLRKALDQLPQNSKAVQSAKIILQASLLTEEPTGHGYPCQ
ncbi:hypothetical protein RBB50_008671 [Rhinocladiella similis]